MNIIHRNKKSLIIIMVIVSVFLLYKFTSKRVILFYGDNCMHCQKFKPEWERIKQSGMINTQDYNCSKNPLACHAYGIQGYPTIMVENGFSRHEYSGERTLEGIVRFYDNI